MTEAHRREVLRKFGRNVLRRRRLEVDMRLPLALVLALLPLVAGAQGFIRYHPPGGVSFPLLAPNGSAAAPPYSFTLHPTWGMFATNFGVRMSFSADDYFAAQENNVSLWSKLGTDVAVITTQANYLASGDPIFTAQVINSAGGQAKLFCTTKDSDEGCTLESDDGTNSSTTRFTAVNTTFTDPIVPGTLTFATLGTPANGTVVYCSDCTKATPCASGGTGAIAKRLNGAWDCD